VYTFVIRIDNKTSVVKLKRIEQTFTVGYLVLGLGLWCLTPL